MRSAGLFLMASAAYGQTCAYNTGKFPNGAVIVYRNGAITRQGPDFSFKVTAGVPTITPINWAPGDNFSTVFSIQVPLKLPDGTAYTSFRAWQENWNCPGSAPPSNLRTISVQSGTITAGAELVGSVPNIEVPIMTNIPGERRFMMLTVCTTTRFLGQSRIQVSLGRPGTNHMELTGVFVPLENADNDSNCWLAHPPIPQFIGPYDLVAYFEVFSQDPVSGLEIPGDISKLSQGQMTWEIAYFSGNIGGFNLTGKALNPNVLQCSGSGSHVDPNTGKNIGYDCAGLLWAKVGSTSIVGVSMIPSAGTWTPLK